MNEPFKSDRLPLRHRTDPAWVDVVLSDFDTFLADHAECERKAAMTAMSFVSRFADQPALIEPMIAVAREELAHFHEVCKILSRRGKPLLVNQKNPYVEGLRAYVRHPKPQFYLDRLLMSALIEARSCERFQLLADFLPEGHEFKGFYSRLAREEAGHYRVFVKQARLAYDADEVSSRLDQLLSLEAKVLSSLPFRVAMH